MPQRKRLRRRSSSRNRRRRAVRDSARFGLSLRVIGEDSEIAPDKSADLQEYFRRMDAWESGESPTLQEELASAGYVIPHPGTVVESELKRKLWDLVNALADLRVFLHHTDHLTDREVYCRLWEESITDSVIVMPHNPDFASHIDMCGSGSEEDVRLFLTYYADQRERRHWLDFLPGEMPEHVDPPFDRDRFLPAADEGRRGVTS